MIKDHYLLEDMHQVSDELVKLQQTCSEVLEKAANADFYWKQDQLDQINQSMKVLQTYNEKKLKRDAGYVGDVLAWRK